MQIRNIILLFLYISCVSIVKSQNLNSNIFKLNSDSISAKSLLATFKKDSTLIQEKKEKKNFYFGKKTKKGFTKTKSGRKLVYENFNYIKTPEQIDPYVRDIYWFNKKKRKIIRTKKIDNDNMMLHGPYIKKIGETVIEQGNFFHGLKHNRWVKLNSVDILQDKEKYHLGWPEESKKSYWDYSKKNLKEIIPIQYGEKDGYYYAFHKNGNLAAKGEYQFDSQVGIWTEYFMKNGRKKREVNFFQDPFSKDYHPIITKEWSLNGKLIYD